jgi:hypothetical protein
MILTNHYSRVRTASRGVTASNYSVTKDFARDLVDFFQRVQPLFRKAENDTRRFMSGIKSEDR